MLKLMDVDVADLKVGDVVLMKGEISGLDPNDERLPIEVRFEDSVGARWMSARPNVGRDARPFKVGDKVQYKDVSSDFYWLITAVDPDGNMLAKASDDGVVGVFQDDELDELELVK